MRNSVFYSGEHFTTCPMFVQDSETMIRIEKMSRRAELRPSKSNDEIDQTARLIAKRLSVIYDNSLQFSTIF